jgi:hypothetical protein
LDVNPLAILLTRVKCRRYDPGHLLKSLKALLSSVASRAQGARPDLSKWPKTIRTEHWFLPDTCHWLQLLRECIAAIPGEETRDFFRVVYASIIRKVSRATTEQGRLFLDVTTAEPDPRPRFEATALAALETVASLPEHRFQLTLSEASCADDDFSGQHFPLVICHPPYFNLYRYSSVTSLETAWLGFDRKSIQQREVREFFKVGKPANVQRYIDDMVKVLRNLATTIQPGGVLALMVGDTAIHGKRIPTTRYLIEAVASFLTPRKISIRPPRFTEASWAASQRRTGAKVGVAMADFVIHFERRT